MGGVRKRRSWVRSHLARGRAEGLDQVLGVGQREPLLDLAHRVPHELGEQPEDQGFDHQRVGQAEADGHRRLPEQRGQAEAEEAPEAVDEPGRENALQDHDRSRPGAVTTVDGGQHEAGQRGHGQQQQRQDADAYPYRRPLAQLQELALEHAGDVHRPPSLPVSSMNTFSSERCPETSSLTSTPAVTSSRLTSAARPASTLSLKAPSRWVTASAPSIRVRTICACETGAARTVSVAAPRSSPIVPSATSLPSWMTPIRVHICSTSPSRWLDTRTVRSPLPSSTISLRMSIMPWG